MAPSVSVTTRSRSRTNNARHTLISGGKWIDEIVQCFEVLCSWGRANLKEISGPVPSAYGEAVSGRAAVGTRGPRVGIDDAWGQQAVRRPRTVRREDLGDELGRVLQSVVAGSGSSEDLEPRGGTVTSGAGVRCACDRGGAVYRDKGTAGGILTAESS